MFEISAFRGNLQLTKCFLFHATSDAGYANHTDPFEQPFLLFLLDDDEHDWILKTCRKGWDENVGYRPDLIK